MTTRVVVAALFIIVGLVLVTGGTYVQVDQRRFRRRAQRTQGRIVSLRVSLSMTSGTTGVSADPVGAAPATSNASTHRVYFPTVVFTTTEGRPVQAESKFGSSPPPGRVGDVVNLLYDPASPQNFRVDNALNRGGCLAAALASAGLLGAAVGVLILIV